MNQRELVLACLAPAKGASHSPVQVQKLFFLIDRNISDELDGPQFNFEPYNYGPFDKNVYGTLEHLHKEGLVDIVSDSSYKHYKLTIRGQEEGDKLFDGLSSRAQNYINNCSVFVRSLNFTQLVTSIYRQYPEMRANSVFQE
jgi:uncharacterized protein